MTNFQRELIENDINICSQLNEIGIRKLTDIKTMIFEVSLDVNNDLGSLLPDLDDVLTRLEMTKQYLLFLKAHLEKGFPTIDVHDVV